MISRKEKQIYGDVIKQFRPTIRTLIIQILEQKLFNLKRSKQAIYNDGSKFIPETDKIAGLKLVYVAIVKEGIVEEMIRLNEQAAEILLSKNTKLIRFNPEEVMVKKGMSYQNKKFIDREENDQNNTV